MLDFEKQQHTAKKKQSKRNKKQILVDNRKPQDKRNRCRLSQKDFKTIVKNRNPKCRVLESRGVTINRQQLIDHFLIIDS